MQLHTLCNVNLRYFYSLLCFCDSWRTSCQFPAISLWQKRYNKTSIYHAIWGKEKVTLDGGKRWIWVKFTLVWNHTEGFFLDDRKQVRKTDKIVNLGTVNRDTTVLELILSYYAVWSIVSRYAEVRTQSGSYETELWSKYLNSIELSAMSSW